MTSLRIPESLRHPGAPGPVAPPRFELVRFEIPLVSPFRTSFGTEVARDVLLVRAIGADGAEGWGECVAMREPGYSSEFMDAAVLVVERFLVPAVIAAGATTAARASHAMASVRGHHMAKAAVEAAMLDLELRRADLSLADRLGGVRDHVEVGVSVGIHDSIAQLLDAVADYVDDGYRRVKLKIEPGWLIEPVAAVRERFGDDLLLQVDANAAFTLADSRSLAELDQFDLLLIEQPLPEEDVAGHAQLATQLRTPICLDESITSAAAAADAIARGACRIVNIKAGRVGGLLEAVRIHDVCAAAGVPVWCGGMLETGVGRAANLALASLPNFQLPGDISGSDRYFADDVTAPFVARNGTMAVPTGPGIGVDVRTDRLAELGAVRTLLTADS